MLSRCWNILSRTNICTNISTMTISHQICSMAENILQCIFKITFEKLDCCFLNSSNIFKISPLEMVFHLTRVKKKFYRTKSGLSEQLSWNKSFFWELHYPIFSEPVLRMLLGFNRLRQSIFVFGGLREILSGKGVAMI